MGKFKPKSKFYRMHKYCPVCNRLYTAESENRVYCSSVCRCKAIRLRVNKTVDRRVSESQRLPQADVFSPPDGNLSKKRLNKHPRSSPHN
jgi:endogenous inhibitor of DNA gyrase (YacG/DUF329 family)